MSAVETTPESGRPGVWSRMVAGGVYWILPNLLFLGFAFVPYVTGFLDASTLPLSVAIVVAIAIVYTFVSLARSWPLPGRIGWLGLLIVSVALMVPIYGIETLNFIFYVSIGAGLLLPLRASLPFIGICCTLSILVTANAGSYSAMMLSIFALIGGAGLAVGMVFIDRSVALQSAQRRIATLAVTAERERIGRDLHDILGHSLTAITVKTELARRLIDLDPERAKAELGEVEAITRQSLADVRATSSGMQSVRVTNEIASAKSVLEAAGVRAIVPSAIPPLDDARSALFGYLVRESVTNVVRHAQATTCTIRVTSVSASVADDGKGGAKLVANSGLSGLATRMADGGLVLSVTSGDTGTTLAVEEA